MIIYPTFGLCGHVFSFVHENIKCIFDLIDKTKIWNDCKT